MICPHCDEPLLYQQRGGRRCSHCGKQFVFEPRLNRLHLHDVKVRRLADKLSDGGRLSYTVTQLWYAAARGSAARRVRSAGRHAKPTPGLAFLRARARKPRPPRLIAMPLNEFRELVLWTWSDIYNAWPAGVVDETVVKVAPRERPRLALVCPDRAVLACLQANGVPDAYDMVLTASPANVPPGVPVLLLHDASPDGCRFAARARAGLPGRTVTVVGLRPRTVLRRQHFYLRLRWPARPRGLDGLGLDQQEVEWLRQRWWSPIAAVRPHRLLAAVTRAAERAGRADADRRRAKRVGFLTSPVDERA
jgi:hypothetical protein